MLKSLLIFFIVLTTQTLLLGQKKYEKESRIKAKEVSNLALEFIRNTPLTKVKWYKEIALEEQTIEAKGKYNKRKYSIEFSMEGQLQDIEITLKKKDVLPLILETITDSFNLEFKRHSIKKIQLQYTVLDYAQNNRIPYVVPLDQSKFNYEVIVLGLIGDEFKEFEYLFSSELKIVSKKVIVTSNLDHLEY